MTPSVSQISRIVNQAVDEIGSGNEQTMPVLLEIQKKLNHVPKEALQELSMIAEVTPCQVTELSTFYSQIRHEPAGNHIIQICSGTNCYLKEHSAIETALKEYLNIKDGNCSPDNEFSIEKVDCLGACSISPAIRIDDKMYGHVDAKQIGSIITSFRESLQSPQKVTNKPAGQVVDAEIRVGIGTCCVANGSKDVLSKLVEIKESNNLNIRIKPVGCTGACSFTPILEIAENNGMTKRYTNVKTEQVLPIMQKHFYNIRTDEDSHFEEDSLNNGDKELNAYLFNQLHVSTLHGGTLSPVSLIEYTKYGGMECFKKCLEDNQPSNLVSLMKRSSFRERSFPAFLGDIWENVKNDDSLGKCIICNSEENDTGALKNRLLLESFPFRVIEGMLISGFATGISKGMFHISDLYPLAAKRVKNAISQCRKSGYLGTNILNSDFSFDISVIEVPGDFVCGDNDNEFAGMPVIINYTETLSVIPSLMNHCLHADFKGSNEPFKSPIIVSLIGSINTPGVLEITPETTIREVINKYGGGISGGSLVKAVHAGGFAGSFISPGLFDMPIQHAIFKSVDIALGSASLVIISENDSIVDLSMHFMDFACHQSCGKCTICRAGTSQMYDILVKMTEKRAYQKDMEELESLCSLLKKGSLCGLGQNAPNAVASGLKYFRKEFDDCIIN